ncbi:MAG TPA: DUF2905 domain-containing protein [Anaerolineales bacterium]
MVLARVLFILGLVLLALGAVVYVLARLGVQPGRLPGDIRIQTGGFTCVFPLVTSILLSILLTVILNVIIRFLNR